MKCNSCGRFLHKHSVNKDMIFVISFIIVVFSLGFGSEIVGKF